MGRVIRFDAQRGWGFIEDIETGRNFFVHYSNIQSPNKFKFLNEGETVSFNTKSSRKGWEAIDVEVADYVSMTKQLADLATELESDG